MKQECQATCLQCLAQEEYAKSENAPNPAAYRRHLDLARDFERRARLALLHDKDKPPR